MSRMRIQRFKRWSGLLAAVLFGALVFALWSWRRGAAPPGDQPSPAASAAALPSRARAPASPPAPARAEKQQAARAAAPAAPFVESLDPRARFTLRSGAVSAFLDERGFALSLLDGRGGEQRRAWGLHWSMAGARRITPEPAGPPLPGVVNDLRGDPRSQRVGLKTYDRVVYRGLFDGVDMEVDPRSHALEYTLRVAAGARVPELRFELDGARSLEVGDGGESLEIDTGAGRLSEGALSAYQDGPDGVRREVSVRYAYARAKDGALRWEYGLEIGAHDPSLPLVIDPTLTWAAFIGGSTGDFTYGMAVDAAGNRYLTGYSVSTDFPVGGGGFQTVKQGANDAYVMKISSADAIVWATFYGGGGSDQGLDIAVDASSNVYVVGSTDSSDIPMVNGFQSTFGGGANKTDAFILKVAANGASVIADSYLGGGNDDTGEAMFLDPSGNLYVTGSARSDVPTPFPTTAGVFQPAFGGGGGSPPDAFIAKIGASGPSLTLAWSSYLGSTSDDWAY
ncbi:MAG TPA: SBBP repeat-containing protein, partial [Myxococcaceae bacterium]|nr:SBBP repeat-containing protein [Myxococcaceae bacterium]